MDRNVNMITGLAADAEDLRKSSQLLFFWFREERGPFYRYSLKEVTFKSWIRWLIVQEIVCLIGFQSFHSVNVFLIGNSQFYTGALNVKGVEFVLKNSGFMAGKVPSVIGYSWSNNITGKQTWFYSFE